uniref:Uncharacterized protein n=1 Tax=candidate division WOR-3 bacterium TaxID=2052148 RepID=A0A7C4U707_UNCW3
MKNIKNKIAICLAYFIMIFMLYAASCEIVPTEEQKICPIYYRCAAIATDTVIYDIVDPDKGFDYLREAFKDANVYIEDSIGPYWEENAYPSDWYTFVNEIKSRKDNIKPWYIEAGLEVPEFNNWGIPSNVLALTFYKKLPWEGASVIFSKKIYSCYPDYDNYCSVVKMSTIHEVGHQYGWLTDKYLYPDSHDFCLPDLNPCCVMDSIYRTTLKFYYKFCNKCVNALKKINWIY